MKIFILLSVIAAAFASPGCGENQHYNSCGTSCPLTCDNYDDPPLVCNLMCNPGCHCKEGYVETGDGRCVKPEQCPAKTEECGENQHYEDCGTDCPLTCDNYDDPPLVCNFMCRSGCHCDEGYVETGDGRCVKPEQCPAKSEQCGENQHYNDCGTACPLTCDNYDDPPQGCVLMCNPGCHCDEGYVKTGDGRCVKPEQCPAKTEQCGENQHYEECGTSCPLTCDNYDDPPQVCVLMCNPGCHCDKGYVKTGDGRCVKPEECVAKTKRCGKHQHFDSCGPPCPLTCDNYKKNETCNNVMCNSGCHCDEGYVQTDDGRCIKSKKCPTQRCGKNQRYEKCGTSCPLTCDNYNDPPLTCNMMCNPGCHCKEGYVKTGDGRCVNPKKCPSKPQQVCGENERYNECGSACPLTCDNYAKPPLKCTLNCVIGCQCESGYVRNSEGRCVRPEECPAKAHVRQVCLGTPETGMCKAYMRNWYYDIRTEKCLQFVYGGCGGNGNRYATEKECMENCGDYRLKETSADVCELPAVTGDCRARMPRIFFNKKTGQCESFIYGGCGGNGNNFKSIEECQTTCRVQRSADTCSLPAEVGLCDAIIPRYYYNEKTGRCQKFVYGGCGGNANNFKTLEDCQKTCA